ncbi:MAG: hypothetical protein UIM53_07880 [Acutalibacteraceae bacterium]|nr:hypothetical protein [Acutalibacteraceae bacterium]
MYKLNYKPEKLDDFNDYFTQYIQTNDIRYFNEFLYFYEPILNTKADKYIKKNNLEQNRLADLKQIFASLLWSELQDYDINNPLPLLQIIKFKLTKSWDEYVRTSCGTITIDKENRYRNLNAVMKRYHMQPIEKTHDEKVKNISKEFQISEKTVRDLLETSKAFKYSNNISDEKTFANEESVSFLPEANITSKSNAEWIQSELQKLSPIEKRLLELTGGINFDRFDTTDKKTYKQTALLLGLTESAVEKKRKRILNKLKSAFGID